MTSPDQGMPQEAPPAAGKGGTNVAAILGLIFAIIGVLVGAALFFLPFVGFVIAVIGLIFSIVGMKGAAVKGGKGVAIAGLIVAILGVLVGGATGACDVVAAASVHEAAQKAAQNAGFKGFGDMMKAATEIPKQQEAAAKAAGYKSFNEWAQKDPKAAAAAARKIQEQFGNRIKNDANQGGQTGSGTGN